MNCNLNEKNEIEFNNLMKVLDPKQKTIISHAINKLDGHIVYLSNQLSLLKTKNDSEIKSQVKLILIFQNNLIWLKNKFLH